MLINRFRKSGWCAAWLSSTAVYQEVNGSKLGTGREREQAISKLDTLTAAAMRLAQKHSEIAGYAWEKVFEMCPTSANKESLLGKDVYDADASGHRKYCGTVASVVVASQDLLSIAAIRKAMAVGIDGRTNDSSRVHEYLQSGAERVNDLRHPRRLI